MPEGQVVAIFIGPDPQGPMRNVEEVEAVAGKGLVGDRYFGAAEHRNDPGREVTLVAIEDVRAAQTDAGFDLDPDDTRRNIVTGGVVLGDLIGRRFRVGAVELEGVRDAAPCRHLEAVTGKAVRRPLHQRAGIRARITRSGTIRRGDAVAADDA